MTYALTAVTAPVYPTSLRASGIGAASALGRLGASIAPLIGRLLLAAGLSPIQIFGMLVVPRAVALLASNSFPRITRSAHEGCGGDRDTWVVPFGADQEIA